MQPVLASFEDFLPLLILFAIWWISSKKKKAMRQKPPSPSTKADKDSGRPTLQEILRQVLLGEAELPQPKGAEHRRPVPSTPPEPVYMPEPDEEWQESRSIRQRYPPITSLPPQPPPTFSAAEKQPVLPSRPAETIPSFRAGNFRRQDLHRAIVWSEILAPPVSMRD
jgi:hypothetical protein